MSLLWRDLLSVALYPDRVVLLRQQRGLKKRIVFKQQELVALGKQAPLWANALNKLDEMLAQSHATKTLKGCELRLVLSSQLVRYLALPALDSAMSAEEKSAYIYGGFYEVYGNVVDSWQIQLNDAAPKEATIAAAVDHALLQTLDAIALKYEMKLSAVQPHLMTAFNLLSHAVKGGHTYLALVEPKRLLLAKLYQGQWQQLRTLPIEADWSTQVTRLIERETWQQEVLLTEKIEATSITSPMQTLLVYAPELDDITLPTLAGWRLQRIEVTRQSNLVALSERNYLMAAGLMMTGLFA